MSSSNGKHEYLSAPEQSGDIGSLGSYRVVSELGKGGMGFVFRAEDKRLKRTVALKVMNKKVAATPHSRARFISEARAMAAVHHDNVATIFEVGEHAGTPFMAMEMLKGETLEEYKLKKERPTYEKIIRFAKETAAGLAAAHAQGIVHRDIKPANIWVEQDSERIKILDFGLALAQTPVDQLAGRGSVVGTPGYLSPEQARTEPLDDRSDLYSLGVVLYELATSKLPLRSSTVGGQLIAILAHKPQPIREVNDKIPKPLADLIHKLLSKEPRNRVRSAAQLVEELKRVEVECESKSEVALAINKLQMGLQEVVGKNDGGSGILDDAIAAGGPGPDPFAALPDDPLSATPASPLDSAPAASGLGSGIHKTAASSGIYKAAPKKAAPSKKTAEPSPLLKYWPIAAGLAVAAIPVLVFWFAGSDHRGGIVKPTIDDDVVVAGGQDTQTDSSPSKPAPKPPANTQSQDKPKDKPKQKPPKKQNRQKQQPKATPPSNPAPNNFTSTGNPAQKPPADSSLMVNANPKPQPKTQPDPNMVAANVPPKPITPEPKPEPEPEPSPVLDIVEISCTEGHGADSTVKRGAGTRTTLGTKPNLAIQTRGKTEIQHTYIRFDLASIDGSPDNANAGQRNNRNLGGNKKPKERNTGNVELILHAIDRAAVGANIRVYGADNPNSERWMEEGPFAISWTKSFSAAGLESLPLLAEVSAAKLDGEVIKISGSALNDFVRTTQLGTVTLILAGGNENQTVQFASRDAADVSRAPVLTVEVSGP